MDYVNFPRQIFDNRSSIVCHFNPSMDLNEYYRDIFNLTRHLNYLYTYVDLIGLKSVFQAFLCLTSTPEWDLR